MTTYAVCHRESILSRTRWVVGSLVILVSISAVRADDSRDRQRAELLEQMRALARATTVEFADDRTADSPRFVDKPVFRYDDQPRRFLDATMWTWTDRGRPVAFQKIEAKINRESGAPEWGYCFTSLSHQRLNVKWDEDRAYQSQDAGIRHLPVPEAPPVASQTTQRRRQLREFARGFTARILNDPRTSDSEEMRLLPTPILEYGDEAAMLLQGAVFAYSTNGTNPDLVIVFEARPIADGLVWHYAPARMTTGGLTVKYRDQLVWEAPFVQPYDKRYSTWTFFNTIRTRVAAE